MISFFEIRDYREGAKFAKFLNPSWFALCQIIDATLFPLVPYFPVSFLPVYLFPLFPL